VATVPVFVGVGAVVSQVAPSRRAALEAGTALVGGALLLRIVADTSSLGWLRWTTPLGWVEELRAFAGPRPTVLLIPVAATAALLCAAARVTVGRDVGRGLVEPREQARPRTWLLGSPTAHALRAERGGLAVWLLGVAGFAAVLGIVSKSISAAGISEAVQERLRQIGAIAITTPGGYLSFTFQFFVLAISLFCCAQMAAVRREEADGRLETLFALPQGRERWLAGRLLLAACGAAALALTAGTFAWGGARALGVHVSLPDLLGAGLNCLPAAALFLGLGAIAFAARPRATAGLAYGVTSVAFVWELVGGLLGAPGWALDASPFHHIGLVPVQAFRPGAAALMLAAGALACLAALVVFRRRDLTGA
jgi:ABC-2 type transport system permease protein